MLTKLCRFRGYRPSQVGTCYIYLTVRIPRIASLPVRVGKKPNTSRNRFFENKSEKRAVALETAISRLSELPFSVPEEEIRYSHHGSGAMFINPKAGT